jgi:hypothetical protein
MIMKLDINGTAVAAQAHQWDDTIQQGTADVAGVRVRFICDSTENGNFNPFYYGYVVEGDIALLPIDFLARLTGRCQCGNAIFPEETHCLDCQDLANIQAKNAGMMEVAREEMQE